MKSRLHRGLGIALAVLLAGCSFDGILDVDLPGRVVDDALDDPLHLPTLVTGVIAETECAWSSYTAAAAVHSDEFIQSSANATMRAWGQRHITAATPNYALDTCDAPGYALYTPLHSARFQSDDVYRRLQQAPDPQVPNKTLLQATVRAWGAFALVAFGEGFCEVALDGGPTMTPDAILQLAEQRLTEAYDLAAAAGNQDIATMARGARARVRLASADFAGAIADASTVPPGFHRDASRDGNHPRRYNKHYEQVIGPGGRTASVAPPFRDVTWKGVPDPRVSVVATGQLGADGATPHYVHDKADSRATGVLMASYVEARLIVAEAAARANDLTTARAILNERHANAGIPPLETADAPTQDDVLRHVIEERRRELFAEGGHRLHDHLRFRGTPFGIPFKGEPGSFHPDGVDHLGLPYGPLTCFPLPDLEREGNPNID